MQFHTHPFTRMTCSEPYKNGKPTYTYKIAECVRDGLNTRRQIMFSVFPERKTGPSYYSGVFGALTKNGIIKYDRHIRRYVAGPNMESYMKYADVHRRIYAEIND